MRAPIANACLSSPGFSRISALALVLMLGVAACTFDRGPVANGLDAYRSGDYATALASFEMAGPDQPDALHALGWMYDEGLGVTEDPAKAATYYERAAALGSQDAQVNLALLYGEGRGVERDPKKAATLFKTAAQDGSLLAQHHLGRMYRDGRGVRVDPRQASLWLGKAAAQGYEPAQNTLGALLFAGDGVERDVETAYFWFALAAEGGEPDAALNRDFVASFLTTEQLAAIDERVEDWTPKG